ncbi:intermembrane phospholipid transport protein YdbH family protein [Sphingomonas glaciei]|uniref:YdbH domain-containing protein n=1 Tax=Sphingomonas glaciei TaxID=2938948 RepID=A0ABY5MXP0_9SPHN|nr:YdbH domain-containing protein [Sphingomonas glaciei]UUR08766.1 YdbH domain-containing protein [Sphingomonas glaciei]
MTNEATASSDGEGAEPIAGRRRRAVPRFIGIVLVALLVLLVIAAIVLWSQRRPIATNILSRELERRGVQASFKLDRIGLRTQQVSNLVIGDPRRPDLTARLAQIQMRIKWNGQVEFYRVVARGVRLNGRVIGRRVSWGQVDRLLPPPSGKPFSLPDISVDLADTSIAMATPYGPIGIAVEGAGKLTGGFKGRLAAASPSLDAGRCTLTGMRAALAVSVAARRPQVSGPLSASNFACPASNIAIAQPRFDIDSRFTEGFDRFTGSGRMSAMALVAGVNRLDRFNADLTFGGQPSQLLGTVKLSAAGARMAQLTAARTRLDGSYLLNAARGQITLVADYGANGVDLDPSLTGPLTGALSGAGGTPLEPIARALQAGFDRATRAMNASGKLRLVNVTGGGAVRVETADVRSASGARVLVGGGGDGITYYWPTNRLRVDGRVRTAGGGLPTADLALSMPRAGGPMSGRLVMQPYAAGGARLALDPVRFAALNTEGTRVETVALLDGPLSGGTITGLRVPVSGTIGPGQRLAFGQGCVPLSFASLRLGALTLGQTRLPVCAVGQAVVFRQPDGDVAVRAFTRDLSLNGRLGASPFAARAARGALVGSRGFDFTTVAARLGNPEAPVLLNAGRLQGTFKGSGINGTFASADATIGRVPIKLTEADGRWLYYRNRLTVNGAATASDIGSPEPRFYPLRSTDLSFSLQGSDIRAGGSLRHPATGALVTNVAIRHDLGRGTGNATLDVPGLRFAQNGLQPEMITRLTEGVIALVNGTVTGQGQIAWNGSGEVTSTGEFSTTGTDLAAAFGPVTGLAGTIRFTDLLGLETAPGQTVSVATINPGILVENGVISYQLLPGQLVRIQAGRWPFMGGELILRETVLNLGRPSPKRLTFEVRGLDANMFVNSFGFNDIKAEGRFDGVLPMIFDDSGGRIVGGRLDSRAPGGRLSYSGAVNKANLGTAGNLAFNALRDLRFRSMIIRLDGDLAGEFGTTLVIDGVGLAGTNGTQKLISRFVGRIPLKFNVSIRGPFRALIGTAKSLRDPRTLIDTTLDRPLGNIPGIVTEVRRREEDSTQTQTPVEEQGSRP